MIIAIMQPTYIPWLGYFGMIYRSDSFVFLDSVQFSKRSWQQRNKIKSANDELMLTIPVKSKGLREQLIVDVDIDRSSNYITKHINAITHCYKIAPYFDTYATSLFEILRRDYNKLADLCIDIISMLCTQLGIYKPMLRSSNLHDQFNKADRLAYICQQLNATQYLAAVGSRDYINETNSFNQRNITVIYNEYQHPIYQQLNGNFISHLSILDLLFNEGPNSLNIILSGYTQPSEVIV